MEFKKAIQDGTDLIEPSFGVPPDAPTVNIKAISDAVKEFQNIYWLIYFKIVEYY